VATPAAAAAERARALGVPPAALLAALALRAGAAAAADAAERAAAARGAVLATAGEAGFPAALAALDLPPPALWIAGTPPAGPAVALVGARKASRYGLEIAGWLARGLAQGGATVVSGFAIGVDAAAHRGALAEPAGRTVAVLGTGLDVDYPRGHRELGARIRSQGALVTEFPPGLGPRRWQFPVRNRLIAALADAVVVVEAAPRSGSLVTARLALDLGRDLYAVPGRLTDELALGTNALLGAGAAPALGPADLLERLGLDAAPGRPPAPAAPPAGLAGTARALWLAAAEPAAAEALAARAAVAIDRALAALLELEIEGHVRRLADARYVRT
jgi:DNA processing protein